MLTLRDVVNRREPDFDNLLAVLQKKQPKRLVKKIKKVVDIFWKM